ncbi:MAG: glycosyltransferase family 4 protein [Thermoplasmata archaeon]|nr:glycosyltransferase family 4 protein [Thermoplasmata archaeon]
MEKPTAAAPSFDGLRILWVAQTFYPVIGGAERYVDELAMEMARKGAEVFVMAPDYSRDAFGSMPAEENLHGYRLLRADFRLNWRRKVVYHMRFLPFSLEFRRVLADVRPDIVHFQYTNPFGILHRQARLTGVKGVFASTHGQDIPFLQSDPLGREIFRHVLEGLDTVFMNSDECELMVRTGTTTKANLRTVYCGTRPLLYVPLDREQGALRVILSVSRLTRRKGVDLIIDAFDAVADKHGDVVLHIVGDGEERADLERRARRTMASDRIRFLGRIPDDELVREFQNCFVHVIASRSIPEINGLEGFGITSIEAMSCGRPVIGSTDGGIRSAIREGPDGWGLIFEQGDAAALAERMDRVLSHPDEADDMGRRGRRAVLERFNWDAISDLMLEEYWQALRG